MADFFDMNLLKEADRVNQARIGNLVNKIKNALWILKDKTIAVLGLAFKPETDDIREASSIKVIAELLKEGSRLRLYDPKAAENMKGIFPEDPPRVIYCRDPYQAAEDSHALLIVTEWDEFRSLDLARIRGLMKNPIIIDGRNIYDPAAVRGLGFEYYCVGRK